MIDWKHENILILGFSKSGISSANYLANKAKSITITEKNPASKFNTKEIEKLKKTGIQLEFEEHKEETIKNSTLIIRSPGIPPSAPVFKLIKKHKIPVISEIDLAYIESTSPFIAITGTNGKTTTTKLVSEILTNSGFNAPVCGNIGTTATSLLDKQVDYFVTEVSSYQIATSKYFSPVISAFLNYTPDHIDWHKGVKNYLKAKQKLFLDNSRHTKFFVLNSDDRNIAEITKDIPRKTFFFGKSSNNSIYFKNNKLIYKENETEEVITTKEEISLIGEHNMQNIMCAVGIAKALKRSNNVIKETLKNFKAPEHRLEFTAEINGIKFYNDSKATNPDSTICALKSFENEDLILIAGGKDKGTCLKELIGEIKKSASGIILFGEASKRFKNQLEEANYSKISLVSSLEEAVDLSMEMKPEIALFSPACASFDMFKNFEERGMTFKNYVTKKNS